MVGRIGHPDGELDLLEERAVDVEDKPVLAGRELPFRQLGDPPVVVGLLKRDQVLAVEEPDLDARRRNALLGVEDVRRDHANLLACLRCSRRISSSSKETSWPPTTTRETRCGPPKTSAAT